MLNSEVRQLELLASIDDLRRRIEAWSQNAADWEAVRLCQSLLTRILQRVHTLQVRMEAPLVVATFGGTGTGKSALVNALVGEEVTRSGRQRPTTQQPILIVHSQTDLDQLGIPLDEVEVIQRDAELLRDVAILDCPDPDTTEGDAPGSNLDRLRTLLPYCDVLLYVSTQQKYRSARVADELASAASGCRMIFIQTHADLDEDIREDWARTLGDDYEVPEIYFVDSVAAMRDQQAGRRPTGDMGRLLDLLLNKLGASDRLKVRRANLLDLLQAGLTRCNAILEEAHPALVRLDAELASQRANLQQRMTETLQQELQTSQGLWERRLLGAVTDEWGMSPFAWVLRAYNGLGGILASTALFRARSTAQLALLGAVQGARWFEGRRREQASDAALNRVSQFGLDDALLREACIVIEGHVASAGLDAELLQKRSFDDLKRQAVQVEDQFVGDAGRQVDAIIADLSRRNSRWWIRTPYELVLSAFLLFVLYRVGRNFFYDSFFNDAPLLPTDFYLAAGFFLILLCGAMIMLFTRRLRSGLKSRVAQLASQLAEARFGRGLFPQLEEAVRDGRRRQDEIEQFLAQTIRLRNDVAGVERLGARALQPPKLTAAPR